MMTQRIDVPCWTKAFLYLAILTAFVECARIRRVVGGQALGVGSWPWLVSLNYKANHAYLALQGLKHLCGGTLINESWVLTAGHCVNAASGSPALAQPKNWVAVLGEYNRRVTETMEQHIEIDGIFLRNYTIFPRLSEDIALLKLKWPAQMTSSVGTVGLDIDRTIPAGTMCMAAGWGQHTADEFGDAQYGNGTIVPHVAQVTRVPQSICHAVYDETWPLIDDRVMCFNSELSQDTCKGDSGGPLVCDVPDGQPVVSGVVSVGMGCALEDYPGVYTRVSKFRDWILSTIASA